MTEQAKTVIGYYFLWPDFESGGRPIWTTLNGHLSELSKSAKMDESISKGCLKVTF